MQQWHLQPALDFEKETGVSGVFRTYLMPGRLPPHIVESNISRFVEENKLPAYVVEGGGRDDLTYRFTRFVRGNGPREIARKHFQEIARTLRELNPELVGVSFPEGSVPHLYDFIFGAMSGFNPADIQHYLDRRSGTPDTEGMKEVEDLHYKNFGKYPDFGWQPSPQTLSLIARQLKERLEAASQPPLIGGLGMATPEPL